MKDTNDSLAGFIRRAGASMSAKLRRSVLSVASIGPVGVGLLVTALLLFGVFFLMLGRIQPASPGEEISLNRLSGLTASGAVASARLYDEDARAAVATTSGRTFYAAYPKSDAQTAELIRSLVEADVRVEVDQQAGKARTRFLVQFLIPLVILASLIGLVFVLIAGKGGAADFAAFSKLASGHRRTHEVTFADVAGASEAIVELREVVDYLKEPGRYAIVGAKAPKGVLLAGPPGTGKTLLARAVAGEAGVPFFSMSGSQFVESLVGVGAARVRDLFRQAREVAPAIIFIDELDAAGRQRGAGMGQGNDEREQTLNQILVEMDGFSATSGIVVLGATNRPDILDPALLRPGRFDRQVVVDPPDVEGRVEILGLYTRGRPVADDLDLHRIAEQCPGFTGAMLANLVNEAALLAVRQARDVLTMADFEEAVDRVIAGPERRSHALSSVERELVAHHEAGHAVVARALGMETGVLKLSIVARGRTLGHTTTYKMADRMVLRASDLRRHLAVLLAGAAVEEAAFGELSTGSEGDLRKATEVARAMVATYGMTASLGRVAIAEKAGEVFLGRDFSKMQAVSPQTLEAVDLEVRRLLDEAEECARKSLQANSAVVSDLVDLLLLEDTLTGPVLDELLARVRPASPLDQTTSAARPSRSPNGKRARASIPMA